VAVGGDPPAVLHGQGPAVLVEEPVVEPAQQRPVRGLGRAAVLAVLEVVDVAVPGRSRARREHAVPVPGGDRSSLAGGPAFGVVVGVEEVALAVEEDGDQGRVAQQPFGGFLGQPPPIAPQDQIVEVVDVAGRRASGGRCARSPEPRNGPSCGAGPGATAAARLRAARSGRPGRARSPTPHRGHRSAPSRRRCPPRRSPPTGTGPRAASHPSASRPDPTTPGTGRPARRHDAHPATADTGRPSGPDRRSRRPGRPPRSGTTTATGRRGSRHRRRAAGSWSASALEPGAPPAPRPPVPPRTGWPCPSLPCARHG
jgi:hypothetical protein